MLILRVIQAVGCRSTVKRGSNETKSISPFFQLFKIPFTKFLFEIYLVLINGIIYTTKKWLSCLLDSYLRHIVTRLSSRIPSDIVV